MATTRDIFSEAQPLAAGTNPTTSTTDGLDCRDLTAVSVALEADSGSTLSATGHLRCWMLDDSLGGVGANWMPFPEFDIALATYCKSGVRRSWLRTFKIASPRKGRVKWVNDTVGASGGTNATQYIYGQTRGGVY